MPGRVWASATTVSMRLPGGGGAAGASATLSAGLTMPKNTSSATRPRPAGTAAARNMSITSGCFHSGSAVVFTGSTLNGALMTLTESPRSLLKPMLSRTSALSFSISSSDSGVVTVLPLASMLLRWFTTTAAFRRLTVPVALRVTRTVLSTS